MVNKNNSLSLTYQTERNMKSKVFTTAWQIAKQYGLTFSAALSLAWGLVRYQEAYLEKEDLINTDFSASRYDGIQKAKRKMSRFQWANEKMFAVRMENTPKSIAGVTFINDSNAQWFYNNKQFNND